MNRLEEAMLRARRDTKLPESFAMPVAGALDLFPGTESAVAAERHAVNTETAVRPSPQPASAPPVTDRADVRAEALPSEVPQPEELPRKSPRVNSAIQSKLVTASAVGGAAVEQYRRLAATLHQAQNSSQIKVVMIASALPGEGKTLTAVNLALTLSESYARRVLLIDADLRRPTLHQIFQAPNGGGLREGLKPGNERQLKAFEVSPRLSLLPAGKPEPDPMSVLTSARMQQVIDDAAASFDWVVIDTPPVGLLADSHLLAAMVHVAVLVVQAGRTPFALIQRAIESLDRERIIGVVLNLVENRALTPGGKYGQYYTNAYGTDRQGRSTNGNGHDGPR
jgi:protein-tyrosine kinase